MLREMRKAMEATRLTASGRAESGHETVRYRGVKITTFRRAAGSYGYRVHDSEGALLVGQGYFKARGTTLSNARRWVRKNVG
jgi:hypothetical protein